MRPILTLPRLVNGAEIRDMTKQAILSEILRLPPEERIELLADAWDQMADTPADVPVPAWHVAELERRLSDSEAQYLSWEEVRSRFNGAP